MNLSIEITDLNPSELPIVLQSFTNSIVFANTNIQFHSGAIPKDNSMDQIGTSSTLEQIKQKIANTFEEKYNDEVAPYWISDLAVGTKLKLESTKYPKIDRYNYFNFNGNKYLVKIDSIDGNEVTFTDPINGIMVIDLNEMFTIKVVVKIGKY